MSKRKYGRQASFRADERHPFIGAGIQQIDHIAKSFQTATSFVDAMGNNLIGRHKIKAIVQMSADQK